MDTKKSLLDMPADMMCPCGGGQSCIVDRRWLEDWVHEDDVLTSKGFSVRKNCFTPFSKAQQKVMNTAMGRPDSNANST